ncbi:pyridoxal-phosphate dependent enzyme [Streptomyces sp. RKAG337]|uniref:pyridoxal-phosphate dependent enzyme n=1 Tax=Streptomyces sp. RKAG337 TaxID=2893404 RepID=UPI002033EE5A|nr:pyridoxal-phosphate dependent enzyme [Streptomyces sp. RKAG337]MCM2430593.1 pyridoxal-phosphate dependent enzyme [Streptomyces sp. RKAG337]
MTSGSGNASRAVLGTWPTPLEPMPRLAAALGLGPDDLWVKRDDLIGLGGGGNKVRKLEWLCGAARDAGATVLVTTGAPQSNHARLTAAAAARLGLDAVLVLVGTPGSPGSGNLVLDSLFGATVVWAGEVGAEALKAAAGQVAGELRGKGAVPALIPFGGSSVVGARGYVECGRELLAQAPDLATVVTALGSGGTMAGLVDSLGTARVLGIHCGAVADPSHTVAELVSGLSGKRCEPGTLRVRLDQVGAGYGTLTDQVMDALLLAARTEGMVLDPIYTGRAMAGLIAAVREGDIVPGHRTVFLHSGGLPGLYGHPQTLARAAAALTIGTISG